LRHFPEQRSLAPEQDWPQVWQAPPTPLQMPPQQSAVVLQPAFPNGMQVTHVLVVVSQSPEQHWEPLVQPVLLVAMQHMLLEQTWLPVQDVVQFPQWLVFEVVSTQVPLQQVRPEQQSEPFVQPESPFTMQDTHVFVVLSQRWLQQSSGKWQPVSPSGMQDTQVPVVPSQIWEQQAPKWLQLPPFATQQVPLSQLPSQHCESYVQPPAGLGRQAHAPKGQWFEQHCKPLVQPLSFGRQHALWEQTWPLPVQAVVQLPQ
jgi:hypothetical protein